METKISPTELAERLSDVLERVRGGERIVVQSDGETIATIAPPERTKVFTWGEFVALMNSLEWPDEDFADDLREIQAMQSRTGPPEWPA